ncbi:MAG: competence/damage-inducible protein A [Candidatus Limnocylindrales bacterium]
MKIETAVILAVGTELTTGSTRDTNSGELAAELTALGVRVLQTVALPDDLADVTSAFSDALERAEMVVSTGGLGPTPDDLTREAIAAACGLETRVDADLEAWLRGLFERRGITMPDANRKQAWLIDGASALANKRGSAPGWYVDRPDGRVLVALPGPPREMWPMWRDEALPRLAERRIGVARVARTLRLTGVGESALVELIGEDILRAPSPQVATYARVDAVDVAVSAQAADRSEAARVVDEMVDLLRTRIGRFVFSEGDQNWADALGLRLAGRTLATVEMGTAGQLQALLGNADYLLFGELVRSPTDVTHAATNLGHYAERVREVGGADIGVALYTREARGDTHVRIAIATAAGVAEHQRVVFLGGEDGRRRAALAACTVLWGDLGDEGLRHG